MNPSRLAAAATAVAIGFGVTLAGVAVGDDDGDDMIETVEEAGDDDEFEGDDQSGTEGDDDESGSDVDGDSANDDGREGDGAEPPGDPAPVDTEGAEVDATVSSTSTPAAPPSTSAETSPPGTADPPSDIDDVRCVPTISVVFDTGEQVDLVVESSNGGTEWRVLDADGSFVISLDDQGVAEVVEVLRNVRFFQGAPINFFDICDEPGVGTDAGDSSDAAADEVQATGEFPCSSRAQSALRSLLLDEEVAELDDVDEVRLALAVRLDELGGRDFEAWWSALDGQLDAFRVFDPGCPAEIENGFTRNGIFCAAARISADDRLFEFLSTVVPAAMNDCTYETS